jgi:hypothetical protein
VTGQQILRRIRLADVSQDQSARSFILHAVGQWKASKLQLR